MLGWFEVQKPVEKRPAKMSAGLGGLHAPLSSGNTSEKGESTEYFLLLLSGSSSLPETVVLIYTRAFENYHDNRLPGSELFPPDL